MVEALSKIKIIDHSHQLSIYYLKLDHSHRLSHFSSHFDYCQSSKYWRVDHLLIILSNFDWSSIHCHYHPHIIIIIFLKGEDLTTEDMMSFYECSDFAFNFNLIVKLKSDNLTGDNIKDAVSKKEKGKNRQKIINLSVRQHHGDNFKDATSKKDKLNFKQQNKMNNPSSFKQS